MKRLAIVLAAFLVLGACKARVNLDTSINKDGSGTIAFAIAFDDEFREAMQSFTEGFGGEGQGGGDLLAEMERDVPEGWDFERFKEDGFEGGRISRDFDSLEDLQEALSETEGFGSSGGEDLGAGGGSPQFGQAFDIKKEGSKYTVSLGEGAFDVSMPDEGGGFGGEESPFGELEFEFVVSITMPGKVLEHNATDKDGSTLTWRFDNDTPPTAIKAVSDASKPTESGGGGGSSLVFILIGAAVAAALIGVFVVRSRGRGGPEPAIATEGGAAPPPPPPPPPPPAE